MALLTFTEKGIYCSRADVYIDPWQRVKRALITHGHSDHSRWGHGRYLCTHEALPAIRYRLGAEMKLQGVAYGEVIRLNGVEVSFHPAGHIVGSAQVRLAYKGEVWVVSGDYKLEDDGISTPFEPVKCHTFITESTFGLPVYKWQEQSAVFDDINGWWRSNRDAGKVTLLSGYALGKAQRILRHLDPAIGPIFTHGAIENTNAVIRGQGISLPDTIRVNGATDRKAFEGSLVLAPPSAIEGPWARKFKSVSVGIASGWMSLRGARRRRSVDRGFVLSDHADWDGLNQAVEATGAERVFVTHGYSHTFSRWLREKGLDAQEVTTRFEGELGEISESAAENQEEA